MELKHLKTFQAAAKYLHFTKAAQQLGFTQPTVTSQIQSLEHELGKSLFFRVGRKTFLTPTGELVQKYADQILSLADEMEGSISKLSNESSLIKIAAPETYCTQNFPPILSKFIQEYPDVQISLTSCDSGVVKEGIESNRFDIGIISGEWIRSGIVNVVLEEEELHLVVSRSLLDKYPPDTLQDNIPYLKYKAQGFLEQKMAQFLDKSRYAPKRIIELGSEEAIKKAVLNDAGIALLTSNLVKKEIQSGDMVAIELLDAPVMVNTSLITQKDKFLSKDVQSFYILLLSLWQSGS